jgi:hypothetical protein
MLVTLALCAGVACAADAIVGSVIAVRGNVVVDTAAGQRALTEGAQVRLEETIVSASGKAKIALADGTVISVGENSRVRVTSFETPVHRTRVNLISGALRLFVARVTPAGRFEVETETAIAAVRGTDWVMEAVPDNTAVALVEGAVAVTNRGAAAPTTVVLDRQGQGTDVRRDSVPTPPAQWGAQRYAATLARATFD